jgi:uncharacterized protein (TIGR03790 family)
MLTKGVPIRVTHVPGLGFGDNRTSLDSCLAALDYGSKPGAKKIELHDTGFNGSAYVNPFWNSAQRFSRAKFGFVLVTRLDGYTVDDAKSLVTWSVASDSSHPKGMFLLDACKGFGFGDVQRQPLPPTADGMVISELAYGEWNADILKAAGQLKAKGLDTMLDSEDAFVGGIGNLIGYVSWGSNDQHFDASAYHLLRFAPGGIAETAVSTSARTFLPTQGGQSLIADLVHQRACGAKGYCDEPLLQAVASPTILFDRYSRGWTLAESYFAASRFIGWEDIVLGDPLCAPFAN